MSSVVQSVNLHSLEPVISFRLPPACFILFVFQHIGVSKKPAQLTLIENEKCSSIRGGGESKGKLTVFYLIAFVFTLPLFK